VVSREDGGAEASANDEGAAAIALVVDEGDVELDAVS
jgi:hypothetical protein